MIPILTESDFSDDSVPARNHDNCSSNSCQLRAAFPVKERGSGGLQILRAIVDNVLYKFLYSHKLKINEFTSVHTLTSLALFQHF